MKGFIFTTDALFAAIAGITIALSFYLILEKIEPLSIGGHEERQMLASLDKLGAFETLTESQLANLLSSRNRCGTLSIKTNGITTREVVACSCNSDEFRVGIRSFVKISNGTAEYSIATLKTCLK